MQVMVIYNYIQARFGSGEISKMEGRKSPSRLYSHS